MIDDVDRVLASTNGAGAIATDSPERSDDAFAGDFVSIDQRLSALRETIRTWEWRAAGEEDGDSKETDLSASAVVTTTVLAGNENPLVEPVDVEVREDRVGPVADSPIPAVHENEAGVHIASDTVKPSDPAADMDADDRQRIDEPARILVTPVSPIVVPVVTEQHSPFGTDPPFFRDQPEGHQRVGSFPSVDASASSQGDKGALSRLWSHGWTKVVVVFVVLVVAVVALIWSLGLANNDPGSTDPSSTGVTQPASTTGANQPTQTPLTAAQLTQYEQYATALEQANGTADAGLARVANPPTLSQVTPVMATYLSALKLYNLQMHYVLWPASMQNDVQADYSQLAKFLTFLQTLGTGSPSGMDAWLSQLHTEGRAAQATDNKIRQDLGLPTSSSFP
jgi:hypothetical protein